VSKRRRSRRRRVTYPSLIFLIIATALYALARCTFGFDPNAPPPDGGSTGQGEIASVLYVVDGDTIDVRMSNGQQEKVRYLGINTPEVNEICYNEATQANRFFVEGKTVRMVADKGDRDPYNRLLRYVYVGDLFVNRAMIEQGYAETVYYSPNRAHLDEFKQLEREASAGNRGCHPTGIFDDGDDER
jgi:endonuclease YncB( thermonuclease family)